MNIKSKNTQEVMKKRMVVCSRSGFAWCRLVPVLTQSSADDELCSIDVAGAMEKPASETFGIRK